MGYTKQAVKNVSWYGLLRVVTRGISFLRTALIARILTPTQFGVAGIATIVLALVEVFTETGINVFLIQRKGEIDKYINTAWIVSIIRGILISLIIIISAYPVSLFFNTPDAVSVLLIAGIVPVLRGFINPSIVKFHKESVFHKEFVYRSSIFIIESVTTLLFTFIYRSAEAIIWGLVAGALFEMIISHIIVRPTPSFTFNHSVFNEIITSGKWLTLTGILGYLYQNLDDIVVGKIFGAASLGLYTMMYRISMLPITEVSDVVEAAVFPVFVRITGEGDRLKKAYLKVFSIISVLVLSIGIIIFIFPTQIITIVLGDQWISGAPVLQILVLVGVMRAIANTVRGPLYALHKQKYMTSITFVSVVGLVITIIPFTLWWGLEGAGYSVLFGSFLAILATIYYIRKIDWTINPVVNN